MSRLEYNKNWRLKNPEKNKANAKRHQAKTKLIVLQAYGPNGEVKCSRCEERRLPTLTIDHINGNGSNHRKASGGFGYIFYRYLIKAGFPEGFQTLCMNCQFVKRSENKEWSQSKDIVC